QGATRETTPDWNRKHQAGKWPGRGSRARHYGAGGYRGPLLQNRIPARTAGAQRVCASVRTHDVSGIRECSEDAAHQAREFQWLDMPPVAFRNWANAHNFYGDFADLDAADLADVQAFFKTYYVPNNAVLLMLGDVKAEEGIALAKKHFGDIPAGAPPPFADSSEPEQTEERRGSVEEKFGTLPAIAIGYGLPRRRTADWYAMALLDQALHGGRAGRI